MYRTATAALLLALLACTEIPPPELEPMPQQQTYSAKGLWTFPNNLSEVPDGAFSRADDAVIRRDGIIETRRGFAPTSATFGSAGHRLKSIGDLAGTLVAHTSGNAVVRYSGGSFSTYTGTFTPPTGKKMRFLQSAKSLYFTTDEGVKRIDEVTGDVFEAGVPQATGGTVALDSNGAHATGTVTISGGSGTIGVTVNGTLVNTTWATSDSATATQIATNLNNNTTVAALVTATSLSNVVTLTAVNGGTSGNAITLAASGTGATASGATLTGGNDGSGWFPANAQTAYRFVWGITNANSRIILGAPSGRLPLTNPATETADTVTVTASVPSWVTTSHFLQVYRADTSATASIPASDDMGLVYETYPSAENISTGSLTFVDVTPDELKGAPLYSSPNAGIPGSEKFQPPVCTDLAEYKGRVWCSATTQRQRLLLTLLSVDATSGGMGDGEGIRITQTGGGPDVAFLAGTLEDAGTQTFKRYTDGSASQNVANTVQSLVRVINAQASGFVYAYYVSGEYDSPGQLLLENRDLGDVSFVVQGENGGSYWTPALKSFIAVTSLSRTGTTVTATTVLPHHLSVDQQVEFLLVPTPDFPGGIKTVTGTPTSTAFTYTEAGAAVTDTTNTAWATVFPTVESDPADAPNGLAFAEFGEGADAVPLGNYLSVGSANYPIERTIALGDTLFLFKEDGVFVLTGDTPETFSVRAFPTPARIVAPDTAVVLGTSIYALTNQGVMAFSESGAQIVSRPIEGTLAAFYAGSAALATTTESVAFAVSYETEREYHLFLPADSSSTYATQAYVYNYVTRAWTRWTKPATTGYVLPSDGLEYLGTATANTALVERKTRTVADYQDATGVAIPMTVDWQVRTAEDPGAYKHWQKVTVMVEQPAPTTMTLSLGTELSATRAEGPFTLDGLPYITSYVPVDQSRSQTLIVGVSGGQVSKLLALKGLAVDVIPSSTKLR